jgi:GNAT superfamily N-acetyltransferase
MIVGVVDAADTRELRRSVLRPHFGPEDPLPGDELPPDLDAGGAVHFGAMDEDGTVVATCFGYRDPCPWAPDLPAWHLRQMATRPERRGEGWGGRVTSVLLEHARRDGAALVWCNARAEAVPFYARQGFEPYGEIFTDEQHTIPHQRMWRRLR